MNTEELLGKKVMHIHSGEVGTVRGVHALDLDGTPGVFVEVPVIKADGGKHPLMGMIWNVNDIEEVEE